MRHPAGCVLFLCAAALASSGCGGGAGDSAALYPAQGTVTFKGAPLAGAMVIFLPEKGPTASGMTDSSGAFKLSSGGRPGAAVGKSKVTVTKGDPNANTKAASQMKPEDMGKMYKGEIATPENKSLVPDAYTKPDTTPLEAVIEPNGNKNKFVFDLVE